MHTGQQLHTKVINFYPNQLCMALCILGFGDQISQFGLTERTGNDKQQKDAGNRTRCLYRNFSQAIIKAYKVSARSDLRGLESHQICITKLTILSLKSLYFSNIEPMSTE